MGQRGSSSGTAAGNYGHGHRAGDIASLNVSVTEMMEAGKAKTAPANNDCHLRQWGFPKAHAMAAHLHTSIMLYGVTI